MPSTICQTNNGKSNLIFNCICNILHIILYNIYKSLQD